MFAVAKHGAQHLQRENLQQQAGSLLANCVTAQGVSMDDLPQWLAAHGTLDPARLLPALDELIEDWVAEWLFDRGPLRGDG